LTAPFQRRPVRSQTSNSISGVESRAPHFGVPPCRGVVDRDQDRRYETSDALCHPRRRAGRDVRHFAEGHDRFHQRRVNDVGFPGQERLPSMSAQRSLTRLSSPPPFSRLCHRRAGFRRSFAHPRSRVDGLDPSSDPGALHPWARWATRRSSNSATNATCEHDRAIVRTSRTALVVAHVRSFLSRVAQLLAKLGQPRILGPGALSLGVSRAWHFSTRSLATRALPQPDQTRTPVVASS